MKKFRVSEAITNRDSLSFKKYLLEVSSINVLDADEEYEIAVDSQNGDLKKRDLLVTHNLRFAISVAKQYVTNDLKLEDLVNEANLGLVEASKRFDPTLGFKFISYAVWWIRRAILMYISDHGRAIRLPNNKNNIIHKLKLRSDVLEQELERKPHYYELLDAIDGEFDASDVTFFMEINSSTMISLDAPVDNDSLTSYSDLLKDSNVMKTDYHLNVSDTKEELRQLFGVLKNEKEAEVLTLLYGLGDIEPLTLKTVGHKLGLTSERVRQIRDKAIGRMKSAVEHK